MMCKLAVWCLVSRREDGLFNIFIATLSISICVLVRKVGALSLNAITFMNRAETKHMEVFSVKPSHIINIFKTENENNWMLDVMASCMTTTVSVF